MNRLRAGILLLFADCVAPSLFQIENKMDAIIEYEMAGEIPLIEAEFC